jgi:hypothetical protein
MAAAKATLGIASGNFHKRKYAHLGDCIGLMDKAVLYPYLGVTNSIRGWHTIRMGKGKRKKEVQLTSGATP